MGQGDHLSGRTGALTLFLSSMGSMGRIFGRDDCSVLPVLLMR